MKLTHLLTCLGVLGVMAQPAHATAIATAAIYGPTITSTGVDILTQPVVQNVTSTAVSNGQDTITDTQSFTASMVAEATQADYLLTATIGFQWDLTVDDPTTETASVSYNVEGGGFQVPLGTLTCPGNGGCVLDMDDFVIPLYVGTSPTTINFSASIETIAVSPDPPVSPAPEPGSILMLATGLAILTGIGVASRNEKKRPDPEAEALGCRIAAARRTMVV